MKCTLTLHAPLAQNVKNRPHLSAPMAFLNSYAVRGMSVDRSENLVAKIFFWILLAVSLGPLLFVAIPAMVDYPNHLARMYILSSAGTPEANPFYRTAWALYPNLAMDLVIPQIAQLTGVENATRLFLLLSELLLVGGTLAIEWVVKGRIQLAAAAALMFLYALPFTWGFLNFEFGLGVALWGIAFGIMVFERSWISRLSVNTIFVGVLFASHFFALGVYGLTLGILELWRAREKKSDLRETAIRLFTLAIPALILLAVMKVTGGAIGGGENDWHFKFKALWPYIIMNGYSTAVSAATTVLLIGFLYVAGKRGLLKIQPAGICLAAGFFLLYLVIPSQLFGTAFVDLRMLVAAALIVPSFCSLSLPGRQWKLAAMACVVAVTLPNLAVVYKVWLSYRADYAAMIQSFDKLKKGSRVLVGGSRVGDDPPLDDLTTYPISHAPTLAVHYADAFVTDLFTSAGKQPIRPRPAFERLDDGAAGPVPLFILTAIAAGKTSDALPVYLRSWHRDFDYLYLLGPHVDNPLPGLLEELDVSRRFVLYKIRRVP
ncbi:MAG TPA: hypothetical protein VIV34_11900 [Pseudolabrys sp.]